MKHHESQKKDELPADPKKDIPVKPDIDPIKQPEKNDPAKIDEPEKNDPTRIDDPPPTKPEQPIKQEKNFL